MEQRVDQQRCSHQGDERKDEWRDFARQEASLHRANGIIEENRMNAADRRPTT